MDPARRIPRLAPCLLLAVGVLGLLAGPVLGAPRSKPEKTGTLHQLPGRAGCLVDSSKSPRGCGVARALEGPGPFMGSRAIAVSGDGRNVYVASSKSDAVAIFARNRRTGALRQPDGSNGCIAAKGAGGCATAIGLEGPNSVAISANGRNVYVTSRGANSLLTFSRNPKTGELRQLPPGAGGCIAALPVPGCTLARALLGPDVVVISPDGNNVYAGSFFGNAVAVFTRQGKTTSEAIAGELEQPAGSGGCIAETTAEGCATGIALGAVEGLAVANEGANVYAASALSNAIAVLTRNPTTGALSQATGGSGCIVDSSLAGCVTGAQLSGANAIATSPGNEVVYATSLFSNSVTTFGPTTSTLGLVQKPGTAGCLVYLRAVGCSFGRAMIAPEGLDVSPDGKSVYVAAFKTGALDVLDRSPESGTVAQRPGAAGCLAPKSVPGCSRGRALRGVSSVAVSPDGRNVYSTAFGSDAVDVFRRSR